MIAGNQPANKLYEKVGFQTFGLQHKYFKAGEQYMDQLFMQLFRDNYQGKK